MTALGVRPADIEPKATEHIREIIDLVAALVAKGQAYAVDGDVYFRVKAFPAYGELGHRDLEEMLAGARVEVDERKEDPMDFALWKSSKPGEPCVGEPVGAGPAGLAHRVLGDGDEAPRRPSSTSTAAARTWSSRTTRTRSPRPRRSPAGRSCASGCTTASST